MQDAVAVVAYLMSRVLDVIANVPLGVQFIDLLHQVSLLDPLRLRRRLNYCPSESYGSAKCVCASAGVCFSRNRRNRVRHIRKFLAITLCGNPKGSRRIAWIIRECPSIHLRCHAKRDTQSTTVVTRIRCVEHLPVVVATSQLRRRFTPARLPPCRHVREALAVRAGRAHSRHDQNGTSPGSGRRPVRWKNPAGPV